MHHATRPRVGMEGRTPVFVRVARACCAGVVVLLVAAGSMSGCTNRASAPAIADGADPAPSPGPDQEAQRQLEQYRLHLAAASRESRSKDEEIASLRERLLALQGRFDSLAADHDELRESRRRAAAQATSFLREFAEAHAEIATYSDARCALLLPNDRIFQPGADTLRPESAQLLNALGTHLLEGTLGHFDVQITVHSDAKPVEATAATQLRRDAWELSSRRSFAVASVLITAGLDVERLRSWGAGPQDPVDSNETAAGRSANRRVEIRLVERIPAAPRDAATADVRGLAG